MSRPLFRLQIAGPKAKFKPLAVAPGQLLLDRWNANDKLLAAWLGRFVGKADWHENAFRFFVRNDQQQQLVDIPCEPATAADLRGPLKRELAELRDRLRKAKPANPAETKLYECVCRGLIDPQPDADFIGHHCQFFKYKDVSGNTRLVWCYGYEPTIRRGDAWPLICPDPDCSMLQMRHPGMEPCCDVCGKPFPLPPPKKRGRGLVAALFLLFFLLLGGAAGGYYFFWPTASVVGRVTRKDGRPVANAIIQLEGNPKQVETNAAGEFQLPGLPWGQRRIIAKAPGYQDATSDVQLAFHQQQTVDFTLTGAAKISGRVLYRSGEQPTPIAAAQVALDGSEGSPVITDAEGRFELTGLLPGEVSLVVTAAGFRDEETTGEAVVESSQPLDILLRGAGQLSGRVVYAADPKLAIAAAEIAPEGFAGEKTQTDEEGNFQVDNLPPGEAKVRVTAPGFASEVVPIQAGQDPIVVPLTGDAVVTGEVQRADTKLPVANAEVQIPGTPFKVRTNDKGVFRFDGVRSGPARLAAQAPGLVGTVSQALASQQTTAVKILMTGGLTATGRVIDAANKEPVVGATVTVADTSITARTDTQGRYTLAGLAAGAITLVVSANDYMPQQSELETTPEKTKLADVGLHRAATLEGRVISAKDQKPVSNALVVYGDNGPKATTDAKGQFKLAPLPTGEGRLVITAADHYPLRIMPELMVGDQTLNDLTLPVLARVRGRVLRALDKTPLADVSVGVVKSGESVKTDADGKFDIPVAPAGEAVLGAVAPGYIRKPWKQSLAPGDQQIEDVLLEGNTPAKGVTLDGGVANQWVPNVKLEVTAGNYRAQLTSNEKGMFDIGKLPPGLVEVKASAKGFMDAKVTKDLSPEDASIDVTLIPLVDVTGVVLNAADKKAVDKAEIELKSAAGTHKATSGKDGTFKVPGVAVGVVPVSAKAPGYASGKLEAKISVKGPRLEVPLQPLLAVQGTVVDAEKPKQPVSKAQVRVTVGEITETATSDASGKFTVRLPAGKVEGVAKAPGYCETLVDATLAAASPKLEIRMPAGHTLTGKVINAVNNQPVAGAWIEVESGGKKYGGETDDAGNFEIKSVPATAAAANVTAPGFEPLQVPISNSPVRIVLSPELMPGEVRIVLTWGERPRDMDGHLYGPPAGGKPQHVSFKNRMTPGATLDVDGKEGLGPETITITKPGKYEYFVAHAENLGTKEGDGLVRSAAEVRVYSKGLKPQTIRVPAKATGPLWHVFDVTIDAAGKVTLDPKKDLFYSDLRPE